MPAILTVYLILVSLRSSTDLLSVHCSLVEGIHWRRRVRNTRPVFCPRQVFSIVIRFSSRCPLLLGVVWHWARSRLTWTTRGVSRCRSRLHRWPPLCRVPTPCLILQPRRLRQPCLVSLAWPLPRCLTPLISLATLARYTIQLFRIGVSCSRARLLSRIALRTVVRSLWWLITWLPLE